MNARRGAAWAVLSLLLCLGFSAIAAAPASAAPVAAGLPFIDLCHPDPPIPMTPRDGLPGLLSERPPVVTPDADLTEGTIWSNGGFGGLYSHVYDLGCANDPSSYARLADANTDTLLTNALVGAGDSMTALTDSVERRAWNPQWVTSFLGSFTARAAGVLSQQIWIPLLGLGLIAATGLLLVRARKGDVSGVASGVGWAVLVVAVGALVLASPLLIASSAQSAGNHFVAGLNGSPSGSASASTTDTVVDAVQYQGYLRRTFGSSDTEVGRKYGLKLLAASRLSWNEYDQVQSGKVKMADLVASKAKQYDDTAKAVKAEDPTAYGYLTGAHARSGVSLLEALFALCASVFRLMADLLMVTAVVLLGLLGLLWLAASPWLVTPSGAGMGRMLIDNTGRCIGYVIAAAVGVWLYTVYLLAALAPGMSAWWSMLLLLVGTLIFWTVLRPDRKMLAMLSLGKVRGYGAIAGLLKTLLFANIAGRIIRGEAEQDEDVVEYVDGDIPVAPEVTMPPPVRPLTTAYAQTYVPSRPGLPAEAAPREPEALPGEASQGELPATGAPVRGYTIYSADGAGSTTPTLIPETVLPNGQEAYQRGDATPPPANSVGEVEVYRRGPTSNHPDDQLVACPWCEGNGAGCAMCDNEGTVPKWAADIMSGRSER